MVASSSLLFFKRLASAPRQVSALAPSSRALARAMAKGLGPDSGPVVEFGPGTGRLTEAILNAGVRPADLTCFEIDRQFATMIRQRFPGVRVVDAGADMAAQHMKTAVQTVISGLPLLSMPQGLRLAIITAAFDILAPGGQLVQFTYGRKPALTPEQLDNLGLVVEKGERVALNLPPARIYRFRRKTD